MSTFSLNSFGMLAKNSNIQKIQGGYNMYNEIEGVTTKQHSTRTKDTITPVAEHNEYAHSHGNKQKKGFFQKHGMKLAVAAASAAALTLIITSTVVGVTAASSAAAMRKEYKRQYSGYTGYTGHTNYHGVQTRTTPTPKTKHARMYEKMRQRYEAKNPHTGFSVNQYGQAGVNNHNLGYTGNQGKTYNYDGYRSRTGYYGDKVVSINDLAFQSDAIKTDNVKTGGLSFSYEIAKPEKTPVASLFTREVKQPRTVSAFSAEPKQEKAVSGEQVGEKKACACSGKASEQKEERGFFGKKRMEKKSEMVQRAKEQKMTEQGQSQKVSMFKPCGCGNQSQVKQA